MRQVFFILFIVCPFFTLNIHAQQTYTIPDKPDTSRIKKDTTKPKHYSDSALVKKDSAFSTETRAQFIKDSIDKKRRDNPKRATLYSAILPGAGQVYNRKYWKVPIVWAAVGIPAYAYYYNKQWYRNCQYALTVTVNLATNGSVGGDSLAKVVPELKPFVYSNDQNGIITYRDSFRKNQDYSVLFFLLFYGLNIVDATVDAHLKDFNVTSDLSFKMKPMLMIGPYTSAGLTLSFDVHKPKPRQMAMN